MIKMLASGQQRGRMSTHDADVQCGAREALGQPETIVAAGDVCPPASGDLPSISSVVELAGWLASWAGTGRFEHRCSWAVASCCCHDAGQTGGKPWLSRQGKATRKLGMQPRLRPCPARSSPSTAPVATAAGGNGATTGTGTFHHHRPHGLSGRGTRGHHSLGHFGFASRTKVY